MITQKNNMKKHETIRQILSAAASVFSEVGFAGSRVDAIAARAQVNKATIYYHIGDKKALYAEVWHSVFSNLADRMSRKIKDDQTPEEKLRTFIQNFAGVMDQHPPLSSIMMREVAAGGQNLPETVVRDMAKLFGIIKGILKEGMAEGIFKPVTPFVIHVMVIGSIAFYKASGSVRSRHTALPDDIRELNRNVSGEIADEMEALILNALKQQPPETET